LESHWSGRLGDRRRGRRALGRGDDWGSGGCDVGWWVKCGQVLGLFVVNKDDIGHTFDIDSLDIHVELPPNSTTAVAIKPTTPGSLEFFCRISGHREAGMVGTITVDA
jgi:hypothetical protein